MVPEEPEQGSQLGFCLGQVSEDSAGLLAMSPCPAGSILPWQVGHWSTCCAMEAPEPSRKGVNPISILPCSGRLWALSCTHGHGPAGLQPPSGWLWAEGKESITTLLSGGLKHHLLLLFPAKHRGYPGLEGWKPC